MLKIADELAEAFDRIVASNDPNSRLDQYWAREFQTAVDSPDLLLGLSAMQLKLRNVQAAVNASDQSERAKNLYLSAISQLEPYVNGFKVQQHSVSNVRSLGQQIDILHLAAASLPGGLLPEINDITLEVLANEIDEIRSDVAASSLPDDLKQLVCPALETLLMAVRSYKILGAEGVSRVYGAAAAELARISHANASASPETKGLLRKALDVAKKTGAAVVWAGAVVSAASGMIEDGSAVLGLSDHAQVDAKQK